MTTAAQEAAIRETHGLSYEQTLEAWLLYNEVFADVSRKAATRHLLHWNEFNAVIADHRVLKYVAVNDDRRMIGLGALTNELEAWPTISPPFFGAHWPEEFKAKRIWYVGFIGARAGTNVFPQFLQAMTAGRTQDLFAMDFCTYNEQRKLPELSVTLLKRMDPKARMRKLDQQTFYLVDWNE